MKLSLNQIEHYASEGFLTLPKLFSTEEVTAMKEDLDNLMMHKTDDIAYEEDGKSIRALHGCHERSEVFHRLTLQSRLLTPITQLIKTEEIYLHQFKINIKNAFSGDVWPWHQDFVYWYMEDGIPTPKNLSVIIFLDEVHEFNAPMYFIPKSHQYGNLNKNSEKKKDGDDWKINFGTKPKYVLSNTEISMLVKMHGLYSAKAPAGSAIFFDSNLAHASSQNISPYNRKLIFLAYNCVKNVSGLMQAKRPSFLASHHYENIIPHATQNILPITPKGD